MGKHTAKTHEAAKRSRARSPQGRRGRLAGAAPKNMRRPAERLEARQKFFNEVLAKSPRDSRYKRPGSLKARTN